MIKFLYAAHTARVFVYEGNAVGKPCCTGGVSMFVPQIEQSIQFHTSPLHMSCPGKSTVNAQHSLQ